VVSQPRTAANWRRLAVRRHTVVSRTIETSKTGAITPPRDAYVEHTTIFSRMLTTACCSAVGLRSAFHWLLVPHTYSYWFPLSLYATAHYKATRNKIGKDAHTPRYIIATLSARRLLKLKQSRSGHLFSINMPSSDWVSRLYYDSPIWRRLSFRYEWNYGQKHWPIWV